MAGRGRGAGAASRTVSPRASGEGEVRRSGDMARVVPQVKTEDVREETTESQKEEEVGGGGRRRCCRRHAAHLGSWPINPARVSVDSVASRPSVELTTPSAEASHRTSADLANGHPPSSGKTAAELEADMEQMRHDYAQAEKQRQDEMHAYLEKIDALQAKLTYLAKETVAAAKEANASTGGSAAERLAAKDERIALLMQEGEKLSKNELRHMQTIKKLRAKTAEDDKATADMKRKLERAERAEVDLRQKLRRAEVAERQAKERSNQLAQIEKQVDELRVDRENAAELIRTLTTQLKEAHEKAVRAEQQAHTKAAEVDKGKIAALENELEDAQIEKKLAIDRSRSETAKLREELDRQKERFKVTELELKTEISGLESRLEAVRARAEEATSDGSVGESSVKLLRQIETLQSQYSLAKENWESIEGSLNARVSQLEKERDEATRRESDMRKRARDVSTKSRTVEEDLEAAQEHIRSLTQELRTAQDELQSVRTKLTTAETALADAKTEAEEQRNIFQAELTQRLEEEKLKWHRSIQAPQALRKVSTADLSTLHSSRRPLTRVISNDLDPHSPRSSSRRSSLLPTHHSSTTRPQPPTEASPILPRNDSTHSLPHPSPSIPETEPAFGESSSPNRTINDLVSTSTTNAAGPSVQLVERMSAAVRRLESEKASFKDELARLSAQRDEARDQVVLLMRDVEARRGAEARVEQLTAELKALGERYEACLQVLGEREEQVEELRGDVGELKRIYRELVERKVGADKI
ncbi:TATA element modulatory factor-like [Teratosphaeria destructans]|uniref:TATA element modulatory factor-like n=1 Tax=Teratosphaeria destructans TaxID=418781 RepID=A0A9W7W6K2_9PEZI|nr:TATA element modulatory factor-like [Teratosphaeria destructans]